MRGQSFQNSLMGCLVLSFSCSAADRGGTQQHEELNYCDTGQNQQGRSNTSSHNKSVANASSAKG